MNWNKGLMVLALTMVSASFAAPFAGIKLNANDLVRIEIGSGEEELPRSGDNLSYLAQDNRKLRGRVKRLELALRQMQDQIYRLEDMNSRPVLALNAPVPAAKEYTCYLKTSFKGTVYGKGSSETEARAKTLQSCDQVGGGLSCDDDDVKCGS